MPTATAPTTQIMSSATHDLKGRVHVPQNFEVAENPREKARSRRLQTTEYGKHDLATRQPTSAEQRGHDKQQHGRS